VEYRGAVPDTFKPGAEVIVEGRFNKQSGVFSASTLITKCPSKYEKMSAEASPKG
jgi:cytochrome c-type biogenesis protein CcmE